MEVSYVIISFLTPIVLIQLGYHFRRNPNEKIGGSGYNTITSRKSQEIWNYAQQIAPKYWLIVWYSVCGINLLSWIICLRFFGTIVALLVSGMIEFIGLFAMFYIIERILRKKFKKEIDEIKK